MPTLRQFQYLTAVDDLKHFGRAAASLNVSQPTLSQQLKTLEQRLGAVLIERGQAPVQLTPIGREIADRARSVLREVGDIEKLAKRSDQAMTGTIRFGVTPTLGPYLMPNIIAQLHRQHPEMHMYIREGIPDEQLAELRRGALDMVVTPLSVRGTDVEVEALFREKLYLVAKPDHPLLGQAIIRRQDMAGSRILSLDRRHHFHKQVENICDDLSAQLLHDYEGTSLDSLRQMAGSGLGVAVLPELYMRSEVGGENIVKKLEVRGWSAERSIVALWRKGASYSGAFRDIADAVRQEARRILA